MLLAARAVIEGRALVVNLMEEKIVNWKEQIDKSRVPAHIAIIMDGNGRWAVQHGMERIYGHRQGVQSVRDVTEVCAELGVKWLTLYAFSTENWNRPREEVEALMELLVETIRQETPTLNKNNVRLLTIGDTGRLPLHSRNTLQQCLEDTSSNTGLSLVLALSYSSRWEITEAVRSLAEQVERGVLSSSDITEQVVSGALNTKDMPDPDLLVRTSGEQRISNFLLWQLAYTELYFTDCCWPDFGKEELCRAVVDYQQRERRFGKTSEQLHSSLL